jgi:hypothetical protein
VVHLRAVKLERRTGAQGLYYIVVFWSSMARFYHIDRSGQLRQGDVIGLTRYNDIDPEDLQHHADSLFPEGVSAHGERYFLKPETHALEVNAIIELVFEYVRRSNYPHRPSRFQSFFGFDSKDAAINFRKNYGNSIGDLWEVECDDAQTFKADMNNLTLASSLLVLSYRASCYWEGRPDPDINKTPIWEILLQPPISIVKKI